MRVLTKGGSVSGFQHSEAEWKEPVNIKDYDIVILNLNSIVENAGGLATPDSSIPQSIEFPPIEDVVKLLSAGNELHIFLPSTRKINLLRVESDESTQEELDLLSWLPFEIETSEESGVSVDQDSVPSRWQWYFDEDFDWPMYLSKISLEDEVLPLEDLFSNVGQYTIAQTTFEEDIASKLMITDVGDLAAELSAAEIKKNYPGSVYLLPLKPDYTFDRAAAELLSNQYNLSIEPTSVPDWAEKKRLPRQQEIVERSQELKREFERLDRFNKLLYTDGSELEKIVLEGFEELGFETRHEISGKRDGAVLFDEKAFILETHGTENAIGVGKVDQLHRWVRDAKEDFKEREIEGLLVANAHRRKEPENRGEVIVGDPKQDLDDYGYRLLTTSQFYEFIRKTQQGELVKEDIKGALLDSDLFVNRT
jgi:hypothetical protein